MNDASRTPTGDTGGGPGDWDIPARIAGDSQSPDTARGPVLVTHSDTLAVVDAHAIALIEAQHTALMETVTRIFGLSLSSALAIMALYFYYYGKLHNIETGIPDWALGLILSFYGREAYAQVKAMAQRAKKKP